MSTPVFDVRRPQTSKMVDELLQEREQVWALFSELSGMKPFVPEVTLTAKVQEFCQILIDYISLGHFGVYRRIMDGTERRRRALETAQAVYPRIEEATDVALAFNDRYETLELAAVGADLEQELGRLGEALLTRFELEDQLMESLMS
jgi:regulator of sigma D